MNILLTLIESQRSFLNGGHRVKAFGKTRLKKRIFLVACHKIDMGRKCLKWTLKFGNGSQGSLYREYRISR